MAVPPEIQREIENLQARLEQLEALRDDLGEQAYQSTRSALVGRLDELRAAIEGAGASVRTGNLSASGGGSVSVAGRDIHQNIYLPGSGPELAIPSDLPPYTRPLGRDEALADLFAMWSGGARRLLVYGARGMGKACLARALAHKVLEDPDRPRFHACLWWSAGYNRTFESLLDYLRSALAGMLDVDRASLETPEDIRSFFRRYPCLVAITKIRRRRHRRLIDFLQGLPGSSTVILTSTTPIAGWNSCKLQKLTPETAVDMLQEKARLVGCEYIRHAPQDKLAQLCDLCDGSPVALDMVIKVFQGDNPDIDLVLEELSTGKDAFRTLCAIAYEELNPPAQEVFSLVSLSVENLSARDIQAVLELERDILLESLAEVVDAGLVSHSLEIDFEHRRFYPAYRLAREYYQKVVRNKRRKASRLLEERLEAYLQARSEGPADGS